MIWKCLLPLLISEDNRNLQLSGETRLLAEGQTRLCTLLESIGYLYAESSICSSSLLAASAQSILAQD